MSSGHSVPCLASIVFTEIDVSFKYVIFCKINQFKVAPKFKTLLKLLEPQKVSPNSKSSCSKVAEHNLFNTNLYI